MPKWGDQIRGNVRISFVAISAAALGVIVAVGLRNASPIFCKPSDKSLQTPPLAIHAPVRTAIIRLQLSQIGSRKFDVILGDSISEGAFLSNVTDTPLLNAAIGGGGIDLVFPVLDQLRNYPGHIRKALLAIGVNDAQRSTTEGHLKERPEYLDWWTQRYEDAAKDLAKLGAEVILFLILPVEDNKPLGSKNFDPALIQQMNESIRKIGTRHGWPVITVPVPTAGDSQGTIAVGSTLDGVHPTAATYKIFVDAVRLALQ
jgi:lysophospholipase L1-like esterase